MRILRKGVIPPPATQPQDVEYTTECSNCHTLYVFHEREALSIKADEGAGPDDAYIKHACPECKKESTMARKYLSYFSKSLFEPSAKLRSSAPSESNWGLV
jgi:hypothetical protein